MNAGYVHMFGCCIALGCVAIADEGRERMIAGVVLAQPLLASVPLSLFHHLLITVCPAAAAAAAAAHRSLASASGKRAMQQRQQCWASGSGSRSSGEKGEREREMLTHKKGMKTVNVLH